jgi:hypothetical protein
MQMAVAGRLSDAGFVVEVEVRVADRGDGQRGYIDIVASCSDGAVAIELDCRSPRAKSLAKLRQFSGFRVVGLRGAVCSVVPDGIDAVVAMPLAWP